MYKMHCTYENGQFCTLYLLIYLVLTICPICLHDITRCTTYLCLIKSSKSWHICFPSLMRLHRTSNPAVLLNSVPCVDDMWSFTSIWHYNTYMWRSMYMHVHGLYTFVNIHLQVSYTRCGRCSGLISLFTDLLFSLKIIQSMSEKMSCRGCGFNFPASQGNMLISSLPASRVSFSVTLRQVLESVIYANAGFLVWLG